MSWEREDGIWGADWKTVSFAEIARRYAEATREPTVVAEEIRRSTPRIGGVSRRTCVEMVCAA